jgi:hypothetical protein
MYEYFFFKEYPEVQRTLYHLMSNDISPDVARFLDEITRSPAGTPGSVDPPMVSIGENPLPESTGGKIV